MKSLLDYSHFVVVFFLCKFHKNQRGITSIEYGLVGLALATLVVAVLYGEHSFVKVLTNKFNEFTELILSTILSKN